LRFVSKTPRAIRWENGVRIRDAINVLKTGGLLADVARAQFLAFNAGWKKYPVSVDSEDDDRIHGIYSSNIRLFRRLLLRGKPIVQTAFISVHYNPRAWSRALQISCADLRTLCVKSTRKQFPLAPILKVCGPNLEVLEIKSPYLSHSQAAAIGTNCVRLKKLSLHCYTEWSEVGPLWEGVGSTLEDLSLSVFDSFEPGEWAAALNLIRMFCPSIRKLDFKVIIEWLSFAQFCISYGDQLEVLKLSERCTEPSCYTDIVAGCAKVKVGTEVSTDELIPSIKALGSHLDTLHIVGDEEMDTYDFDIQQLQEVSQACSKLKMLALHPHEIGSKLIVDILNAILADRKPSLERLEIRERTAEIYGEPILPGAPTTNDILSVVGDRTGDLREFIFACYTPELAVFDDLAKKNQHLENVQILLFDRYQEEEEEEELTEKQLEIALEGLVKSFAVCPKLRTLVVDNMGCFPCKKKFKKVVEVCRKLRNRKLSIEMMGHLYLQ